ncbi:unnamed protein product [Rotaria magnacalcarata]|uniref:Uncharacterized protein n=1 Tax=Rotaria magnacalcarata TaxID=392030 RepID=A0A819BKH9_9BILA|nr:unnamed protein product [Rotaria magnacalcarata]
MKKKHKNLHKQNPKTATKTVPQVEYLSSAEGASLSIKTIEVVKEQTLIDIVQTGNFKNVQKYIFKTDVGIIASKSNIEFWSKFLEYFPDLTQRAKIAENIIDKISLHEMSLSVIGSSLINLNIQNNWINHLKAETLLVQGENILNIILKDKSDPTALSFAKQGVESIELSYWVYQSLLNIDLQQATREFFLQKVEKTHETLYQIIESMDSLVDQYNLFELALTKRQQNFPEDKMYLVDLFINLGSYGIKLPTPEIKLKAIQYSEEAYNIICKQELDAYLGSKLCQILSNLRDLYGQFGDNGKSLLLSKQIAYLKTRFDQEESKEEGELPEKIEYQHILIHGIITDKVLEIKKQIQVNVLDKIQVAAARGKWVEIKIYVDNGVGGYLDENWLKSQLGPLATQENYETALPLCFEVINIGIMNSQVHNPICAAIFCQRYPEVSYLGASKYSVKLLAKKLEENEGLYNKFFEKEMITIINERIKEYILAPIELIVKKGEWSHPIQTFTKAYPELVKRIMKDHAELVTNKTIEKCINIELEVQEKIAYEKQVAIALAKQETLAALEQEILKASEQQDLVPLKVVVAGDSAPIVEDLVV